MHGRIAPFLEVITLLIILLVVGLVAPHVLVVAPRAIVVPIISMMIVRSSNHYGCVGCFDGSCDVYTCDVDGSSIHG